METRKDPHLSELHGPGTHLRQAREGAEMSIDQVASALRIERKTVELIEADAYDRLPAPIFVRGYIRGYARELGLAETPILDMYDRQGIGHPPPLVTGVTEPHQAHTSDTVVRLVSYAVAAVLLMLVGLWWHSQDDRGFGIGGSLGDLVDWSSDTGENPPPLAAEEPGAAPEAGEESGDAGDAGDADGESVAMVSDGVEADGPPQDETFPVPPSDGEAASGDRASTPSTEAPTRAATAGSEITGTRAAAEDEGEGESDATAPLQTGAVPEVEGSTVTPSDGDSTSDGDIVDDSASDGAGTESVSVAVAAPSQSGAASEVEGSTVTPSDGDSASDGDVVADSASGGVEVESVSIAVAAPSQSGTAHEVEGSTVTPSAEDSASDGDVVADSASGGAETESASVAVAALSQSGVAPEAEGSTVTPSTEDSAADGDIVDDNASNGVEAESVSVAVAAPSQSGAAPEVEDSTVTPPAEDSAADSDIVDDSASDGVEAESVSVAVAAPSQPGTAPEVFENATVTPPAGDTPSSGDTTFTGDTTSAENTASGGDAAETVQAGAGSTAGAGTGQPGLTLEFVHESWVEVYDRDRARLFFALVQPGRVLSFDGPQPFEVLLGYGEDVRVAIDGRTFDHTPHLKGGVARFSIGSGAESDASVAGSTGAASPDAADSPADPPWFQDRGE